MQTIEVKSGVYISATYDPRQAVEKAAEGEVGLLTFWPDVRELYEGMGYVYLGTAKIELKVDTKGACVEAAKQLEEALAEKQKKHREEVANLRARIDSLLALEYTPPSTEPKAVSQQFEGEAPDDDLPF